MSASGTLQTWLQAAQATQSFEQIQLVQATMAEIARQVPAERGLSFDQEPVSREDAFGRLQRLAADPVRSERIVQALGRRLEAETARFTGPAAAHAVDHVDRSSTVVSWFQKIGGTGGQVGIGRFLGKAAAAFLRDPNRGLDPHASPGDTRVLNPPAPVRTVREGAERLMATGWNLRTDAIRKWSDGQLKDLPRSRASLEKILSEAQWFRAQLAGRLEPILSSLATTGAEKEGLYKAILAYQDALERWLSTYNDTHPAAAPLTRFDVEFVLERDLWERVRTTDAASTLTDEDLIARGLSPLALKVLQIYDAETKRSPVQGIPEDTIRHILTENPHLRETPEARDLLRAAEAYYSAGKKPNSRFISDYVAAMKRLLSDPVRARHFLIELSFVDTARNLMLQDPGFIVEEVLKRHADQVFETADASRGAAPVSWVSVQKSLEEAVAGDDPEAVRVARVNLGEVRSQLGRRAMGFLFQAREELEKAERTGDPLKTARAKQIHDNVLSVIVFHFGTRLMPYLVAHPRYANLRPNRPGLEDVGRLRRGLYVERENLARSRRAKWEAAIDRINGLWGDFYDPGLARMQGQVFEYLTELADEMMGAVRRRSPGTHQRFEWEFAQANKRAKDAIREFSEWEEQRRRHVERVSGKRPREATDRKPFVPRDYNRAIEKALQSLLGTQPELPILQKKASRKTRKIPGVLEVTRAAMRAAGVEGADFHPVVPLFSAFASNYRPLPREEKRRVSVRNPVHVLGGITGGLLADLYAAERRFDGNDYGDARFLEWSIMVGTGFHENAVVADPLTVGGLLTHFNAPVIDEKHTSWGSDFNAMIQIAGAVSPRRGDRIRMRPPRILAKGDLAKMIPVMGRGIRHFTIPVEAGLYRGVEVRAARSIAFGDVNHDLGFVEGARDLRSFRHVRVSSRTGARPIGVFSEITMPVPDAINPYDPTREGALAMPPISSPLPPIGRGTWISMMAEGISGKPQMMLWPVVNGSFATFPKPDLRVRLYRGETRTVIPDPVFNDSLPGYADLSSEGLADFLFSVGNLQRSVWWINAMVPENHTPAPQEAEYLEPNRGEEP